MGKMLLTAERVREVLDYRPDTGVFRWRQQLSARAPVGARAGHRYRDRYLRIKVDGSRYPAHRLAWLYVHGSWPAAWIDHLNGDHLDNRIVNLRDVAHATNMQNTRGPRSDNAVGLMGVAARKSGRFTAKIKTAGSTRGLGSFDTAHEAHDAYLAAKRLLHPGCTI